LIADERSLDMSVGVAFDVAVAAVARDKTSETLDDIMSY
jgi:hypothetical protein